MKKMPVAFALIAVAVLAGLPAWGDEAAAKPPVEKVSIPIRIEPRELRVYDVTVKMRGRMPGEDKAAPVDIDASYLLRIQHQYGRREGDGLLVLEISASKAEATVAGQKLTVLGADFPRITLLLDTSFAIVSAFGIPSAGSDGQALGLNYGNLIVLFFVPDGDKPHAVGESWTSKVKMPGSQDDVNVTTTLKSVGEANGAKTASIHQVWGWFAQKKQDAASAYSRFLVDSTFALDTGKLLKSHADTLVTTKNPAVYKQEEQQYKVNTKIDISLGK
jgi:hypothetical protein